MKFKKNDQKNYYCIIKYYHKLKLNVYIFNIKIYKIIQYNKY